MLALLKNRHIVVLALGLWLTTSCGNQPLLSDGGDLHAGDEPTDSVDANPPALISANGITAEFVTLAGEGRGKTVIFRGEKMLFDVANARPISFSPSNDILLLREYSSDDDLQLFLLNIGAGEIKKEGPRIDYVFGGRWGDITTWSSDGGTLQIESSQLPEFKKLTIRMANYFPESAIQ